jgi:hypothetical protein
VIEADSIPVDLAVPRDRNGTFGPHLDRISRQHCVGNIVARVALKRQAGGFGKASCRGQNAGRGRPSWPGCLWIPPRMRRRFTSRRYVRTEVPATHAVATVAYPRAGCLRAGAATARPAAWGEMVGGDDDSHGHQQQRGDLAEDRPRAAAQPHLQPDDAEGDGDDRIG